MYLTNSVQLNTRKVLAYIFLGTLTIFLDFLVPQPLHETLLYNKAL